MYSPASEDGGSRSENSSDSKSSLDAPSQDSHPHHPHHHHGHHHQQPQQPQQQQPQESGHHVFSYALGPALAALRKKRKKFSASRASTPAMTTSSGNNSACTSSTVEAPQGVLPLASALISRVSKKQQLQRASSVPTRSPELTGLQHSGSRRHETTQSQQPSLDDTPHSNNGGKDQG